MRCYDIGGYGENVPLQELYVAMAQLVIVVWDSSNQDSIEMAQSILQDIKGNYHPTLTSTICDCFCQNEQSCSHAGVLCHRSSICNSSGYQS